MKFNVFGRLMTIENVDGRWKAYTASSEGKRREIHDVPIPSHILEAELKQYLADIFHESATDTHPNVEIVD